MAAFASMRGPTRRLEGIGLKIALAPLELPDRISGAVEKSTPGLIEQGYRTRTSPYGTPWPQPVAGNKPMERNGKLRRSYEVVRVRQGSSWYVWASNKAKSKGGAFYGAILQTGFTHYRSGKFIVPRKQVPDKGKTAPRWATKHQEVARREGERWHKEMMR